MGKEIAEHLLKRLRDATVDITSLDVSTLLSGASTLDAPIIAIVGARKMTAYGASVAQMLAKHCAEEGYIVLSGMAYGIDSAALEAACDSGGITIAVLPSGLKNIYPKTKTQLADRIARSGVLLSEYNSTTPALKQHCIARNRLVAGLADIVVVVEGSIKSGTRHTVEFALNYNKTLMGVPGSIFATTSEAPNDLIQNGALSLLKASDICLALQRTCSMDSSSGTIEGRLNGLSHLAKNIYKKLGGGVKLQQLSSELNEPVQILLQELTMLESEGLVTKHQNTWQATIAAAKSTHSRRMLY
jgi:DNA processing protein